MRIIIIIIIKSYFCNNIITISFLSCTHSLKLVNSNVYTRLDFFTSLPLMNHSSLGLGVEEYLTSIVTSSPFLTLYSLWRMSRCILGAVSITRKKENTNWIECCSCHEEQSGCIAMKIAILDHKYVWKGILRHDYYCFW
jgi:hypothetical protein